MCELSNVMMQFNQTTRFILRNPDLLPLRDLFRNTPVNMTNWDEGHVFLLRSLIWMLQRFFLRKKLISTGTTFAKCCCFWQLTMNIYQKLKWYEIERHAFLAPIILQNESCALHRVASKTVHKSRVNPRRGQKGLLEGAQTFIHPSTKRKTL